LTLGCRDKEFNETLEVIAQHCRRLEHVELCQALLVNDLSIGELARCSGVWLRDLILRNGTAPFEALPMNEASEALITSESVKAVAKHCPNLHALEIAQSQKISAAAFAQIAAKCRRLRKFKGNFPQETVAEIMYAFARHQHGCLEVFQAAKTLTTTYLNTFDDPNLDSEAPDNITADLLRTFARGCPNVHTVHLKYELDALDPGVSMCAFIRTRSFQTILFFLLLGSRGFAARVQEPQAAAFYSSHDHAARTF
jgi:hypothetical protein